MSQYIKLSDFLLLRGPQIAPLTYLNLLFVFQANLIKMEMTVAIAAVMTPTLAIWKMAKKETRARGGRMPHNKGIREFLLELFIIVLPSLV